MPLILAHIFIVFKVKYNLKNGHPGVDQHFLVINKNFKLKTFLITKVSFIIITFLGGCTAAAAVVAAFLLAIPTKGLMFSNAAFLNI
jgi:hypothetical protein